MKVYLAPLPPMPYHVWLGEDIPPSSVQRHALTGMPVTEAASLNHHVVKWVVILVLGVPASSGQQGITKCEETGEVHPDICHGDQI